MFEAEWLQHASGGQWHSPLSNSLSVVGITIDSRTDVRGKAFLALKGDQFDGHDFISQAVASGATTVIAEDSRASSFQHLTVPLLLVKDSRLALGKIAAAHRKRLTNLKVIAITGSSGKTTTKRLVHAVLSTAFRGNASEKSFNNDVGVPLTLLSATENDQYLIVEIGMNHPGEIAALSAMAQPDIGILTMVGSAHLEGLGSLDAIAAEKASLFEHLTPGGVAIVNADSFHPPLKLPPAATLIRFGESDRADLRLRNRQVNDPGQSVILSDGMTFQLPLQGRHNAANALAAVAAGRAFGLSDPQIVAGLAAATPAPMRLEQRDIRGVQLYNDAYNANPESMAAAIETFGELSLNAPRRIVIVGDMLELGPTSPDLHAAVGKRVADLAATCPLELFVAVGKFSVDLTQGARCPALSGRIMVVPELSPQACRDIADHLMPGDHVLLKASRGTALERIVPFIGQPEPAAS